MDHDHEWGPGMFTRECQHPSCTARESDGEFTSVGQVHVDGRWQDYARDTPAVVRRWVQGKPGRRAKDWLTGEVLSVNPS